MTPMTTRLNKYLAFCLGVSRREADELIAKRRVMIEGVPATLGAQIVPGTAVTVDGTPVIAPIAHRYIALHKPVGFVCSRKKQGTIDTIYSLLPPELHHLKPVGRLDKDSSGLLLLTDDGDFAHRMTHPSFYKTKVYEVGLDASLQPLHQQMISDFGVMLEDGKSQFLVERVEPIGISSEETSAAQARQGAGAPVRAWSEAVSDDDYTHQAIMYRIIMSEGRNRQIRRTFAALGYTVTRLHRTQFGNYSLGDISPGEHKEFTIS